jgi:hypothetical protein
MEGGGGAGAAAARRDERRRLFLADLDSVRQAAAVESRAPHWSPRSVPTRLRGVIRMSVLVGGRVVVTDFQLLDGRVFLALGPTGFGDLVCADPMDGEWPLEACIRGPSLEESLYLMLTGGRQLGTDALAPYEFSVIEDVTLRRQVARQLANHRVTDLERLVSQQGLVNGVIEMLATCGLPSDQASAIGSSWSAWCDAAKRFACVSGVVPAQALEGPVDADSHALIRDALHQVEAPSACTRALARIADPDGDIVSRSRAYVHVLDPLRRANPENEAGERLLRDWVDAWYHRSVAAAINADILDSHIPRGDETAHGWDDRHWLTIDSELASELGAMPPEVFAGLRFRTRHDAQAWWKDDRHARKVAHRRLAVLIEQHIERVSMGKLIVSGSSKVVVLMAAVLVTGLDTHGWIKGIVLIIAALLAAGPELYAISRLSGRRLDRRFSVSPRSPRNRAHRRGRVRRAPRPA